MKGTANNVDEYLQEVLENRREAMIAPRNRRRKLLVGYDERIGYGMPSFSRNGTVKVGFASQRNSISFSVLKTDVVNRRRDELPAKSGKGCIRYSSPSQMDFEVIEQMLRETVEDSNEVCA